MRTDIWLQEQLKWLLEKHFADVELLNEVSIGFGRRARRRFGSISMSRDKKKSHIRINGFFRDNRVPEQIICATIAHELCHYAHGFSSPLQKKYRHPHAGGVIKHEMEKRGLGTLYEFEKKWTKENWREIVRQEFPQRVHRPVKKRRRRKSGLKLLFDFLKP